MKKIHVMIAGLLAMLPTMLLATGGGSTTYYAALKAQVSGNSSGMGKVYAGTSNSAPSASNYDASSKQSSNQSSTTQNEEKTFYAFASENEGYEFVGWSTSNNGTTYASTSKSYSVKVKCSSSTESSPTLTTVYANFKKKVLASFGITFETTANGTYTVDGSAPANKTGLTEATSVVLASSDPNFLNWNINGTVVNNNPYTVSCTANTAISADFLTADQVTSVTTLSSLTAALANNAYKKITIPSGTTLTVAKGSTVTVPAGKQLVVDGTLAVAGTVSNSGAISGSGKLYKISYSIDQGEVIAVKTADGKECGAMTCACQDSKMPRYCKTTVTQNSPNVNGTISCTTSWGVLLNGTTAYAISKQSPKAVKVSLDTAKDSNGKQSVVNKITAITADTDTVNENANYVLFADMTMSGPLDSSKLRSTATVDCAGKKLSAGTNSHSSFGISVLNGSFSASASQWQNAHAAFFNVSSVSLSKVKGTGSTYYFYDCGTKSSPCSISITYYSSTRTSDYKTAYFYSGYYSYSFNSTNDGSGKSKVYGGSYTTDPSAYIPTEYDGILQAQYDGSKYYDVTGYKPPAYVCAVGGTEYESLADAVSAAKNGDVISLSAAIELEGSVTIPSGKSITLSLENHVVMGGKIVNNGTLLITDSSTGKGTTAKDASGGILKSDIENYGTLAFIFGTYEGAVVNKAGTLTTHNGLFKGSFTREGGTVNIKGGHFSADVSELVAQDGYIVFHELDVYSVCEIPNGTMYKTDVGTAKGYGATPYTDADYDLLDGWFRNKSQRTAYSNENWKRIAELLCFYQVFNNRGLDATLTFDRAVAAGSLVLYAKSTASISIDLKFDLAAGQYYRALSETLISNGYYSKTYKALWDDSIKSVAMAVTDKLGNNAGTVCTAMVELWSEVRASDYSSTGRKETNTVYIAGQKRFTIDAGENKAMIRPETGAATFYQTVAGAVDAVADGGTVMLANDCEEAVAVSKACTINVNGFSFTGSVTAGEGYIVKVSDGVYKVTAIAEALVEQVKVENVVSQVVSTEWLEANEISTENKTEEEIQAAVQETLKETDANGNTKWENLVIGQTADEKAAVTAANGGDKNTVNVAVTFEVPKDETTGDAIDTGYTVKYAFDKVDNSTGAVAENGAGDAQETPSLDLTSVSAEEGPSYFKMRAVLEAEDGSVTTDVPVEKTIGVLKVDSDAEYTILAVPWKSLGSGDVKASELVHAASLSDGDTLYAYDGDGNLKSWVVEDGVWTSPKEYDANSQALPQTNPDAFGIARGQGVWLQRQDPENSPIYMVGQPASEEEEPETELKPAENGEASWNLVASPKLEEMDIAEAAFKNNTDDEIIVPTAGAPKHYTCKDGAWGYPGGSVTKSVTIRGKTVNVIKTEHKTDDTIIKPGTGFWYLNKGEGKSIQW